MDAREFFTETLKVLAAIPDRQINAMWAISRTIQIAKGESFIRVGDIPSKFAIVISGLFRYFYVNDAGVEFTKGFFAAGTVISSYSAMIQDRVSYFTIEALESSWIVEVPYARWREMARNDLHWSRLLISLLERGYCTKEARERELLLCNAEERYRSFLLSSPGLEARIKQHQIASYLGISPVTLSRIRRKCRS